MIKQEHLPLAPRIPLPAPLAVFLEFTNRCNFKCSFCPESLDDYALQSGGIHKLSWTLFRKICSDLKDMGGVKVLRFYGLGETFLHPDAVAMITEACSMGIAEHTDITTNGSMLYGVYAKGLIYSGIDCIRVSIYGTTMLEMRQFTQSPIGPETIHRNLVNFLVQRGERPKPLLYAKISADDPAQIARFRASYGDAADGLEIVPLHNWTGQDSFTQISRPSVKACCPSPFYQIKINSDGIVSCCATDWRRDTAVGDVNNESLKDIWNGERMKAFRVMHLEHKRSDNAACRNCTFVDSFHDDLDSMGAEILG